jgi:hypothetical protein
MLSRDPHRLLLPRLQEARCSQAANIARFSDVGLRDDGDTRANAEKPKPKEGRCAMSIDLRIKVMEQSDEIERLRGLLRVAYAEMEPLSLGETLTSQGRREAEAVRERIYKAAFPATTDQPQALRTGPVKSLTVAAHEIQPQAARTPAEDACMDIFNDFDEAEVVGQARSIKYAWEAGRQLQEAMRIH